MYCYPRANSCELCGKRSKSSLLQTMRIYPRRRRTALPYRTQRISIAMNAIELLQDSLTGNRSLAYDREDAAAERWAHSLPMVSVPQEWSWVPGECPDVRRTVQPVNAGSRIGIDPTRQGYVVVPAVYVGKLQGILRDIEDETATYSPNLPFWEPEMIAENGTVLPAGWLQYRCNQGYHQVSAPTRGNSFYLVDPRVPHGYLRSYTVPSYLCDEICDTSRFRRAE